MRFHRLERQTANLVLLIVVLGSLFFWWYLGAAQKTQHEEAPAKVETARQPAQAASGIVTLPVAAAPAAATLIPVVAVQVPAPSTYSFTIPQGYTMTRIEEKTCNLIDDVMRRNQGNPAIKSRDIIIAGGVISLLKVEPCSPVMAKAKAFPENVSLSQRGASRDKSLPDTESQAPKRTRREAELARDNCSAAGWGHKRGSTEQLHAQADCIEAKWGDVIRTAIREETPDDGTVSDHYLRVVAVMLVESSGNPKAKSTPLKPDRDPCYGLMQLQPGTAKAFGLPFKRIYDTHLNIRTGIKVLFAYTKQFEGRVAHGLVAYNVGPYNDAWKYKRFNDNVEKFDYFRSVERVRTILAARTPKEPVLTNPS